MVRLDFGVKLLYEIKTIRRTPRASAVGVCQHTIAVMTTTGIEIKIRYSFDSIVIAKRHVYAQKGYLHHNDSYHSYDKSGLRSDNASSKSRQSLNGAFNNFNRSTLSLAFKYLCDGGFLALPRDFNFKVVLV